MADPFTVEVPAFQDLSNAITDSQIQNEFSAIRNGDQLNALIQKISERDYGIKYNELITNELAAKKKIDDANAALDVKLQLLETSQAAYQAEQAVAYNISNPSNVNAFFKSLTPIQKAAVAGGIGLPLIALGIYYFFWKGK